MKFNSEKIIDLSKEDILSKLEKTIYLFKRIVALKDKEKIEETSRLLVLLFSFAPVEKKTANLYFKLLKIDASNHFKKNLIDMFITPKKINDDALYMVFKSGVFFKNIEFFKQIKSMEEI